MRQKLRTLIVDAVNVVLNRENKSIQDTWSFQLERPKIEAHGDYSSNIALVLSGFLEKSPREVAQALSGEIEKHAGFLSRIEIAGPGFLNFHIKESCWRDVLSEIQTAGRAYGRSGLGQGKKVHVEFVSANPTGPLHIGHGRGAAIGDSLSNLLHVAGFQVEREYYINDVGTQMEILGASTCLRYREILGEKIEFPENYYQGDYIKDIARTIVESHGKQFLKQPQEAVIPFFSRKAWEIILEGIKKDLTDFNVVHDHWFSEQSLFNTGTVERALEILSNKGLLYQSEGALWFKATAFGDEKDRVVVRGKGAMTYFASDIAYHLNKFERSFDLIIDIWGADHHGYVPRIKAIVEALGQPKEKLHIVLVQLVNLIRSGKQIAMSTRSGEFVTLREVIDEVGKDAARFMFLTRRSNSHLDFDLDLVKRKSQENPVYYVQYAHARISSVLELAAERGINVMPVEKVDLTTLTSPEELRLLKLLAFYPDMIEDSAAVLEPHRIPFYLGDLATALHNFYNKHRIIGDDEFLMQSRFALIQGVQQVLKNGLKILGVSAPEKM